MVSSPKGFQYHEWLCKTNFSFLSSTIVPYELIQTVDRLQYQSLCINDFDGLYGIARTYNDKKHLNQNDFKLNYGVEIHLQKDHHAPLLEQQTLCLNVFNQKGYQKLCQLLSQAHTHSKTQAVLTEAELLAADLSGIFAIIPMRGLIHSLLKEHTFLLQLQEKIPTYLCLTKTYHRNSDALIPRVYQLAKRTHTKLIFSQDSFMLHHQDKSFHDILLTIKNNNTVTENLRAFFPNGERSLHTKAQLYQIYHRFPGFDRMLQAMGELNERSDFSLASLKYQYPKEMIPEGYCSQSYLEELVFKSAKKHYQGSIPHKVLHALNKELDLIQDLEFADYFLTVWDIVAWARSQDILCQGRGSAANSAVCFVLGVTSCDPALFDLLFERFMSKERGDPPDIDIDFEHERREEVLQYIYSRYGRKRAAMVANVITFRSKGAIRAVGKALGVSEKALASASDALGSVIYRKEAITNVLAELAGETSEVKLWSHFSEKLLGFPRHMGVHSGGFIISQHEIDQLVPQEPASMPGRTVIQWCKDDIEELGFFKIDCLSLGMLSALRKCFDSIHQYYGKKLELYQIPQDDAPTYQMIQQADTVGVFQIESRAQQEMSPRFKPRNLYDLVIQIATIRPGPLEGDAKKPLIRRRNGLEQVTYPCKEVEDILQRTMGVLVFQEQLMRIAVALGNFTPGEANELRKNIGAWNSKAFNRNLHPFMKKLFHGLKEKGIKKEFALQLMQQMKGFAHYGFPESHAISFAFLAYASAYLKCHYPAAFYQSILNSQPMGFYSPHALLESAKRNQVTILPLCIQNSCWDHQLELLANKPHRPKEYGIRLGFRLISGLRQADINHMTQQRLVWRDMDHFIQTTHLFKDDYIRLASANAFQCFGLKREQAIWKCSAVPYKELIDSEDKRVKWRSKNLIEQAEQDFKAFGTTLKGHPISLLKNNWNYAIKLSSIKTSRELRQTANQYMVSIFGLLISKQAPPSANGMVFYTLEDETGFLNLVFTPTVYQKYHSHIENIQILCVSGILQKNQGSHSILVKSIHIPRNNNIKALKSKKVIPPSNKTHIKANKINYH